MGKGLSKTSLIFKEERNIHIMTELKPEVKNKDGENTEKTMPRP